MTGRIACTLAAMCVLAGCASVNGGYAHYTCEEQLETVTGRFLASAYRASWMAPHIGDGYELTAYFDAAFADAAQMQAFAAEGFASRPSAFVLKIHDHYGLRDPDWWRKLTTPDEIALDASVGDRVLTKWMKKASDYVAVELSLDELDSLLAGTGDELRLVVHYNDGDVLQQMTLTRAHLRFIETTLQELVASVLDKRDTCPPEVIVI